MEQFGQLLYELTLPDNDIRNRAENTYNELRLQPDRVLSLLCEAVTSRAVITVVPRQMALLLLKNCAAMNDENTPIIKCSPQVKETVKAALMDCILNESEPALRSTVLLTTCGVASKLVPLRQWDAFFPFLFSHADPPAPSHLRVFSLNAISRLSTDLQGVVEQNLPTFLPIVERGLNDQTDLEVKYAALEACGAVFALAAPGTAERERARGLMPIMLEVIGVALNHHQDDGACNGLNAFAALAEVDPQFLKPIAGPLLDACLTIAGQTEGDALEDRTRRMGLEVIMAIAEHRSGLIRHVPGALERLLDLLWHYMVEFVDTDHTSLEEWETEAITQETGIEDSDYLTGEQSLDRLVVWAKAERVLPTLLQRLPSLLESPDWRARHAAMMTVAAIAEGCTKAMKSDYSLLVNKCLEFLGDPHSRVRWAAVTAIGQLATDWKPLVQMRHYEQICPGLVSACQSDPVVRVRSRALGSLVNLNEFASEEMIMPFADQILSAINDNLTLAHGTLQLREMAVTCLSSVAGRVTTAFDRYVDSVCPVLWAMLADSRGRADQLKLHGRLIEALSLIIAGVGVERVGQGAHQLMEAVVAIDVTKLPPDDPTAGFLTLACSRLAAAMGPKFLPYLPAAMSTAMKNAAVEVKPRVENNESAVQHGSGAMGLEEDVDGWDWVTHGSLRIGIHSAVLQEKAEALSSIVCYAEDLGPYFAQYVQPMAELAFPLLTYKYGDIVKEAAASFPPYMVRSAGQYVRMVEADPSAALPGAEHITRVWCMKLTASALGALIEAAGKEEDLEVLTCLLAGVQETLLYAGETIGRNTDAPTPDRGAFLSHAQLTYVVNFVREMFVTVATREKQRMMGQQESAKGGVVDLGYGGGLADGYDSDDEDAMEEERQMDDRVLSQLDVVVQYLFENHGSALTPIFLELLWNPLLSKVATLPAPQILRHSVLCMLLDAFECGNAKGGMEALVPRLVEAVNEGLQDPAEVMQQAAVYGAGTLSQVMSDAQFAPMAQLMVETMERHAATKHEEGKLHIAENAVAALGKLLKSKSHLLGAALPTVVQRWLAAQPVENDYMESVSCLDTVAHFLQTSPQLVLGAQNENAAQVARVVQFALGKPTFVSAAARPCLEAFMAQVGNQLL